MHSRQCWAVNVEFNQMSGFRDPSLDTLKLCTEFRVNLHLQGRVRVGLWQGKQHFHDILKSVREKYLRIL